MPPLPRARAQVTSAKQLLAAIEIGQQRRRAANSDPSRSHLITSIVVESTNLQTQSVMRGKISFVDLAGSEWCVR